MKEEVLVIIKPDGMRKRITGEVVDQFLDSGLVLRAMKAVAVKKPLAQKHYGHLKDQFFFKQIVSYLCGDLHDGHPVIAMVLSGEGAIAKCRSIAGATNPEDADPVSVRGKFGRITTKGVYENLVHVSSSKEEAVREIKLWFKKSELLTRAQR